MTARQRVTAYLGERVTEAFNEGDTDVAQSFDGILGVVERMNDTEYEAAFEGAAVA